MPSRLDTWLTENGMAPSRTKAKALVSSGAVKVNGLVATKVSYTVASDDVVEVDGESALLRYVSRGGLKLEEALRSFQLDFSGARVLDIGSSTGGFTDCALQHGAAEVFSVDVGTDCMNPQLAADSRVHLYEQTDIRNAPTECFQDIDFVVCDASFISLKAILPVLSRLNGPFQAVMLIKPQFECGAVIARKCKGIVTDEKVRQQAVEDVVACAWQQGLSVQAVIDSPILGGDGNKEFLMLLERGRK